ncbi:Monocarboxylate transporter 9, partial [Armadillidium vulgare]
AGGAISIGSTVIAVSKYFVKHRGFAIGITSLGTCLSSFLSPLISNYLIQHFGYVGSSRIFGAIILNQCVGASLLQPLEWHMKPEESDSFDDAENDDVFPNNLNEITEDNIISEECQEVNKFYKRERKLSAFSTYSVESLHHSFIDRFSEKRKGFKKNVKSCNEGFTTVLKNVLKTSYYNLALLQYHKMIIVALASGCFTMGYINFQLWIPFVVTNSEYSLEVAAWCVSAAAFSNVVGRVLISIVSDRKNFNVTYGHMSGMFLMALSVIAFSLARNITLFLIFVCCWGFGTGIAGSSSANNMIKILGMDLFPATYGIASLFRGAFSIIFGPIADFISIALVNVVERIDIPMKVNMLTFNWSGYSLDLKLIEQIRDMMGRRVRELHLPRHALS